MLRCTLRGGALGTQVAASGGGRRMLPAMHLAAGNSPETSTMWAWYHGNHLRQRLDCEVVVVPRDASANQLLGRDGVRERPPTGGGSGSCDCAVAWPEHSEIF